MEIILTKDVQNIGEAGDIVKVKDGYARNFLLPQNLATKATAGAIANREKNLARIKAKHLQFAKNLQTSVLSKSQQKPVKAENCSVQSQPRDWLKKSSQK